MIYKDLIEKIETLKRKYGIRLSNNLISFDTFFSKKFISDLKHKFNNREVNDDVLNKFYSNMRKLNASLLFLDGIQVEESDPILYIIEDYSILKIIFISPFIDIYRKVSTKLLSICSNIYNIFDTSYGFSVITHDEKVNFLTKVGNRYHYGISPTEVCTFITLLFIEADSQLNSDTIRAYCELTKRTVRHMSIVTYSMYVGALTLFFALNYDLTNKNQWPYTNEKAIDIIYNSYVKSLPSPTQQAKLSLLGVKEFNGLSGTNIERLQSICDLIYYCKNNNGIR